MAITVTKIISIAHMHLDYFTKLDFNFQFTIFKVAETVLSISLHVNSTGWSFFKYSVPVARRWTEGKQPLSTKIPRNFANYEIAPISKIYVIQGSFDLEFAR